MGYKLFTSEIHPTDGVLHVTSILRIKVIG